MPATTALPAPRSYAVQGHSSCTQPGSMGRPPTHGYASHSESANCVRATTQCAAATACRSRAALSARHRRGGVPRGGAAAAALPLLPAGRGMRQVAGWSSSGQVPSTARIHRMWEMSICLPTPNSPPPLRPGGSPSCHASSWRQRCLSKVSRTSCCGSAAHTRSCTGREGGREGLTG